MALLDHGESDKDEGVHMVCMGIARSGLSDQDSVGPPAASPFLNV